MVEAEAFVDSPAVVNCASHQGNSTVDHRYFHRPGPEQAQNSTVGWAERPAWSLGVQAVSVPASVQEAWGGRPADYTRQDRFAWWEGADWAWAAEAASALRSLQPRSMKAGARNAPCSAARPPHHPKALAAAVVVHPRTFRNPKAAAVAAPRSNFQSPKAAAVAALPSNFQNPTAAVARMWIHWAAEAQAGVRKRHQSRTVVEVSVGRTPKKKVEVAEVLQDHENPVEAAVGRPDHDSLEEEEQDHNSPLLAGAEAAHSRHLDRERTRSPEGLCANQEESPCGTEVEAEHSAPEACTCLALGRSTWGARSSAADT